MRFALTGGTGLIGRRLIGELRKRGDEVTVLTRNPAKANLPGVEVVAWQPADEPAPAQALEDRDVIVNLLGESVGQRWTSESKRAIIDSRVLGTRNLIAGIEATTTRPRALVSGSAIGYYGSDGAATRQPESAPPGDDFLASVTVAWEREAQTAETLGLRVAIIRTGVLLDPAGGALASMLRPFKMGLGGPIAGGRQYISWIHSDDLVALFIAAADNGWRGAYNGTAPEPVTNKEFSKTLGRVLHRPAVMRVPGFVLRRVLGEMADIVTGGQRAVPERALAEGFRHRYSDLETALKETTSSR
ncbi:MAG TPA: TIGR01777 family oxidoreductase [Baekduia sp.]|nr:TIGR01777 family oxidoreductase [Baekduia sp.]